VNKQNERIKIVDEIIARKLKMTDVIAAKDSASTSIEDTIALTNTARNDMFEDIGMIFYIDITHIII
jgi:hypothetical protein